MMDQMRTVDYPKKYTWKLLNIAIVPVRIAQTLSVTNNGPAWFFTATHFARPYACFNTYYRNVGHMQMLIVGQRLSNHSELLYEITDECAMISLVLRPIRT